MAGEPANNRARARRTIESPLDLGKILAVDDVFTARAELLRPRCAQLEFFVASDVLAYALSAMKPLTDCRLYAFVDTAYLLGRPIADIARQLCEGGADLIQLRAKSATVAQIREMGKMLLPITRAAGVGLVINDHFAIAEELGADLCHLGQEDFFEAGYERVSELAETGFRAKIGLSSHAPHQAIRALRAGAAYIAVGPVYATGTKPMAKPVTLDYVRWAAANVTAPWFAIGGITLQNLEEVIAAGARRVCVVSAILNARDIKAACSAFKYRLEDLTR